ncbi:MAG: phenylacetate-CoA oxygenase subunit PaaJ [Phycisphaerae bacterium]|nr:phenylacetate-CoA oxygenase subunit PaaJ [Phycisphaerae bacterium]
MGEAGRTSSPTTGTGNSPRVIRAWQALETVADPEIPVINVVEMGMIADVRESDAGIVVDLTPTFAGCPAIDLIRTEIRRAVRDAGESDVTVCVVFDPPWTSDRITEEGRQKLKDFGLAPPSAKSCGGPQASALEAVPCPHCGSVETEMESLFGPTLCRSIHYCQECRQSFEHFKEV